MGRGAGAQNVGGSELRGACVSLLLTRDPRRDRPMHDASNGAGFGRFDIPKSGISAQYLPGACWGYSKLRGVVSGS